jgi:glycopeptide antibiotics resistance protein
MSLKTFHIFFIALSILTAFGFAVWLIYGYTKSENVDQLLGGVLSIVAGAGLIVYGIRFLRKLKHVSYL